MDEGKFLGARDDSNNNLTPPIRRSDCSSNGKGETNGHRHGGRKKHILHDMRDFSMATSAHGIPHIGASSSWAGRILWSLLVIVCLSAFSSQAYYVIEKFMRNERNVFIEVKYMTAGFPAVTICNLNPYKNSLVQNVTSLRSLLDFYQSTVDMEDSESLFTAINAANHNNAPDSSVLQLRQQRQVNRVEPAYDKCVCSDKTRTSDSISHERECYRDRSGASPRNNDSVCICIYEQSSGAAWPCHSLSAWNFTACQRCDAFGRCIHTDTANTDGKQTPQSSPCVCKMSPPKSNNQNKTTARPPQPLCLRYDPNKPIRKLWEEEWTTPITIPTTTTTPRPANAPPTTMSPEYKEAMGFGGMTDTVAIMTKAKENLVFEMAALPKAERERLSYDKSEFLRKCSFNGEQCDIERDFKLHIDPVFGNCYTFNFNTSRILSSSKAGPMYGLRLMTYVNVSDYMSTTDASGVRISIHDKTSYPFPDTFGFNAPTGFISSFGLTLKKVHRMSKPYGSCADTGELDTGIDFIYDGYEYSVEACYRSCFQHKTVEMCGCADPRFPAPNATEHCRATDSRARTCLLHLASVIGDFHKVKCDCQMPCKESVIWAAFSTARWPSGAAKLSNCGSLSYQECFENYQKHAAMVEVFLEKLSYENLKEYEAYGWVNVIADFGGQLGLWMGFSVITCIEFLMLLWHLLAKYCCPVHPLRQRRNRRQALDL